jgi:hypothetical protein
MCQKCARLTRPVKMRQTDDLFDLAEQLAPYVDGGMLEVIQASSPLPELRRDRPVKVSYFYVLRCTRCGREFQLSMDTHRLAGQWF